MNDPLGLFEDNDPLGLFAEEGPPKEGLFDKAVGAGEAALSLLTSIPASVYGPAVGISQQLQGRSPREADKLAGQVMEANTYTPRSEFGRDIVEGIGTFMNQVGIPAGAVAHTIPIPRNPKMPKFVAPSRSAEISTILDGVLEPVKETPAKPPIPTEAQTELLPSNAPQYGINHENNAVMWTRGDTGTTLNTTKGQWIDQTPYRADLSMDVTNAQDPLALGLFDDTPIPGKKYTHPDNGPPVIIPERSYEGILSPQEALARADQNMPQVELPTIPNGEGNPRIGEPNIALGVDNNGGSFDITRPKKSVFRQGYHRATNEYTPSVEVVQLSQEARAWADTMPGLKDLPDDRILTHWEHKKALDELQKAYGDFNRAKNAELRIDEQVNNEIGIPMPGDNARLNAYESRRLQLLKEETDKILKERETSGSFEEALAKAKWEKQVASSNEAMNKAAEQEAKILHQEILRLEKQNRLSTNDIAEANDAIRNTPNAYDLAGKLQTIVDKKQVEGINASMGSHNVAANEPTPKPPGGLYTGKGNFLTSGKKGSNSKQRGAIDVEAISQGISNLVSNVKLALSKKPKQDTSTAPVTPEAIALKADRERKAAALGLANNEYERVKTAEDAMSNPGPDIMSIPGRDYVKPGLEGLVRSNTKNRILKFGREVFLQARNQAERFSSNFVTGNNGINKLYRSMSKDEWVDMSEILKQFSEKQKPVTDELLGQLGLSEKQTAFIKRLRDGLDEMYYMANDALLSQGLEPFQKREGYLPAMFSGNYTTLMGHTDKTGRFIIKGVAQGDTKFQMDKAVEHYKSLGEQYGTALELKPKRLRETSVRSNNVFNGFNDLVSVLAKGDKDFNTVKAQADAYAAQSTHDLFDFKVHEKKKTGVSGSLGDRPWLSREENAKQLLEGIINYMEEGSRFYSYQNPLNEVKKLTSNPDLGVTHKNTLAALQKYSDNITGNNLNPVGGAANWVLDRTIGTIAAGIESKGRSFQGSYKVASKSVANLRNAASAMMMGVFNIGFALTQLTQPILGAIPELINMSNKFNMGPLQLASVLTDSIKYIPTMVLEKAHGVKSIDIPQHWKDAYDYAVSNGMLSFSETELAHEVLRSKAESNMWQVANWPAKLGELASRPPVFFAFVDALHKSGFKGEDLMLRAQAATDYAMANYHPDERPMIYSTFGVMGQFMGALTTYKHNLVDQIYTRGEQAAKGNVKPLIAMAAAGYVMFGISGIPGYQEADEIVQRLTDQSIKDWAGTVAKDHPDLWHGWMSAKSGYDFQSRTSMSSLVPDDVGSAISPQASMLAGLMSKALEAATLRDEASLKQLAKEATPSGLKGVTEKYLATDKQGYVLDKAGQRKYTEPRTKTEQVVRGLTGIRPLKERLEDEDLYARSKVQTRNEQKIAVAAKRLQLAWINGNMNDAKKWIDEYTKRGGNPEDVLASDQIEKVLVESKKSARQRLQGTPDDSLRSIRRYQNYQIPK